MSLPEDQVRERLKGLAGWALEGNTLRKTYRFKNFVEAFAFAAKVALIAEKLGHHPDLLVQYGRVQVSTYSHDVGGVTDRDLELARRVEEASR
jgi:4a-hydroxytetrahydrobiopterin dehydratase